MEKTWIQAMIEREAIPKAARTDTVAEFCAKWDISEQTYRYQRAKKENKRQIIGIWLNEAVSDGSDVLAKLGEKAKNGDTKAIELYIKFVLELAENLDIKSDGKGITVLVAEAIAQKNALTPQDTERGSE